MAGLCETCTACCRVYSIPKLKKHAGKWCQHCAIGVGCKIYEKRPDTCSEYTCMWLESFSHGPGFPLEWRPDKCKVVFGPTTKPHIIAATTFPDYPDAWRKGPAREIIDKILDAGLYVVVGGPTSTFRTMLYKGGERLVEMTEPDANGMQWKKRVL